MFLAVERNLLGHTCLKDKLVSNQKAGSTY